MSPPLAKMFDAGQAWRDQPITIVISSTDGRREHPTDRRSSLAPTRALETGLAPTVVAILALCEPPVVCSGVATAEDGRTTIVVSHSSLVFWAENSADGWGGHGWFAPRNATEWPLVGGSVLVHPTARNSDGGCGEGWEASKTHRISEADHTHKTHVSGQTIVF
jgi:hypothetical protein